MEFDTSVILAGAVLSQVELLFYPRSRDVPIEPAIAVTSCEASVGEGRTRAEVEIASTGQTSQADVFIVNSTQVNGE